jgi:molybdate transport system permease protein
MTRHRNAFQIASVMALFGYALLLAGILLATGSSASVEMFSKALATREIQHSIATSLLTSTLATILAMWVAAPAAYLLSRSQFRGKVALELLLDLPVVMPPLVLGLGLLLLFQTALGCWIENSLGLHFTYSVAGVVLAQFVIATAFAIRSLRATFDEIPRRNENVARTLGASDFQAFCRVVLPAARRGIFHATAVSWARSLGEFGPILVFAGTTRMKTEVMPTTIFLELNVGNLESAAAVSILLLLAAAMVLAVLRWIDSREEARP